MTRQYSLIPSLLEKSEHKALTEALAFITAVLTLAATAQISIPLPFTPVPITGQTFGVALISLLWGFKRGFAATGTYLTLGLVGLPFFAMGRSGLTFAPSSGYLLGMLVASAAMGTLADRGWTSSFQKTWGAAFIGSLMTFTFGVLGLSLFIETKDLLTAGVLPFIPGDIFKTFCVCALVQKARGFNSK